ncbi:hypothetical protein H6F77_12320 [Microcoleus sp. FACHB-831]|uniref:hypothetical protein n=1 Tax=Microcoleus sp. FACHB-831 TaxID=2692827 RepID=UPI001686B511|nr:hypothetical protein [Microcoleus sp. FACHB-831]MBD1921874.1 hypothetical protein [Microcoleus sp. FACHB-831]
MDVDSKDLLQLHSEKRSLVGCCNSSGYRFSIKMQNPASSISGVHKLWRCIVCKENYLINYLGIGIGYSLAIKAIATSQVHGN